METKNNINAGSSSSEPAKEDSPLLEKEDNIPSVRFSSSKLRDSGSFRSIPSQLLESLSKSDRGEALKRPGVGAAAFLIRDAVLGVKENPRETLYDPYTGTEEDELRSLLSIICGRISGNRYFARILDASVWILALLSIIEPPPWCRNQVMETTIDNTDENNKFGSCGILLVANGPSLNGTDDFVQYYPNSSSMWITLGQSMTAEWFCLTIITFSLLLKLGRDGFELFRFFRPGINRVLRVCQCLSVVLLYIGLVMNRTDYHPFVRLALLATFLRDCQTEVIALIRMVREASVEMEAVIANPCLKTLKLLFLVA